jgi:hypothetical protein
VFIELTDHLRCPAAHAEQFLVLLPTRMEGRRVVSGELGCPVCGKVVMLEDGVVDWGGAEPSDPRTAISAEAVAALLGLSGPGGYIALVGGVGSLAGEITALMPGIGLALVNPPAGTADSVAGSVLRAARLPLKTSSMRGVVLGGEMAALAEWIAGAVAAVLPGLRVVVERGEPPGTDFELLARSEACWVGKKSSR